MIAESLLHQIEVGRNGQQWGYSMGLPKLEEIIDGVSRGVYTLVFSPTGSGKSSLALYSYVYRPLMEHLEDGNFKITYFSLEMSAEMIYAKILSMYIFETYGIELSTKELLSKKRNYQLSSEYYKMVQDCLPWLQKVEKVLTIYDKALSAGSLYTILMDRLEEDGTFEETSGRKIYHPKNEKLIHLVVIDHLSLVRRSNGRTLKEEMDLISSYLVTLRNMCKISPLVIMQANRNSTSMDRRKEGLNNLRIDDTKDTGAPAQDSEIIISIFNPHREKLASYRGYDIKQLGPNFRSITVLKNRYGEADVEVGCAFYGAVSIFTELPKPEDIFDYEKYKSSEWLLEDVQEDDIKKNEDNENKSERNFIL
jgi:replicative DNA helicase